MFFFFFKLTLFVGFFTITSKTLFIRDYPKRNHKNQRENMFTLNRVQWLRII